MSWIQIMCALAICGVGISAQAICVKNVAEYKEAQSKFPEEFSKMPVYITTESSKGDAAIKVDIVKDRFKLESTHRKLFFYGGEDAYIISFCIEDNKITIDFENRKGEREKEKDFEADYDPTTREMDSTLAKFKFSSEAEYKRILLKLKSRGKAVAPTEGSNSAP